MSFFSKRAAPDDGNGPRNVEQLGGRLEHKITLSHGCAQASGQGLSTAERGFAVGIGANLDDPRVADALAALALRLKEGVDERR